MSHMQPAAIACPAPPPAAERGATSVLVAALLPAVLALLALLIEVGAAVATHRELLDTADAAARAGATAIDEDVYRASDGQIAQLDPDLARQRATEQLSNNGHEGSAAVTATTDHVTVLLTIERAPVIFVFVGTKQLIAEATAVPQTGITQPEAP